MPQLSKKGLSMPPSPIRKLVPFAEGAKARGVHVYHLNIGQPDIPTPEHVMEHMRNIDLKVVEYSHSAGFESYRKGLSKYYKGVGIEVSYEQIMVTTGGSEALLFGFMSCFDIGDEVIIPEPYYANYNGFATAAGVKVVPVVSDISSGFALPPIAEFEKLITPRTRGILVCNPGNPTGYLYSREEVMLLAELVKKHDLFLFADEVYREFCYDGRTHTSVMEMPGLEQHAVLIDSVSKRYSMCGARIGALVSRNADLMQTALKFGQARLSPPTFGQIASEAALDTPPSYFEEVKERYVARRDVVVEMLNKIPGVFCPNPGGAFYCVAQLPVANADHFCQWMLESFSYEGATVMMAPASGFYSNPDLGLNQVRIAYVLTRDDLKKAIIALEKGLEAYKG
jgi:aspartate aminotransferase